MTPWTAAPQASLSFIISRSLLKLTSIESVTPSSHLILSPLFLFQPSIFPSISLFQWINSSHQVTKVLELQYQSFQWIFRVDFLQDGLVGSPCSPRHSQESSPTPQFKSINSSMLSLLYGLTLTSIHDYGPLLAKWCLCFTIHCLGLSWLFFQGAHILISWLPPLSAVILEPKKINFARI